MAGLQRSSISFRRQGSSGLIWDDKLLADELGEPINEKSQETSHETTLSKASENGGRGLPQEQEVKTDRELEEVKREDQRLMVKVERSRSNGGGGRGFRTGKVSPAIEPPSPKVSACGCCGGLRKYEMTRRRIKNGKRKM
ncbi:hypothetical protein Leryth_003073 [Lithospermum erythrorhizon]|uniref:MAPK kinase substrate protein n=1 Tax=Lithospermum erythrorhizon TaxID=34254 RepID=A0AAV3RBL7_LITER|nr:hypothetical protein Leryth_003073 [Lithospermum erythrorhizon]